MLTVENLHAGYETARVLEGISLTVEDGESVALLGRNGMGKTTLVRAVCGLRPPTVTADSAAVDAASGGTRSRVTFADTDLLALPPHEITGTGIGLVPQGRRVFGSLTVEENLGMVGGRRKKGNGKTQRWTIPRVFEFFPRLEERARAMARTLSGGEQQMLAIARALMTNPELLIMDEPSEGLAPTVLEVIRERLTQLRNTGLSVLVAEQNVDFALAISDRVFILGEHGSMAWSGPSETLHDDPEPLHQHLGL
ncbi:ABC transporter ATP-binding protein [Actinobacteria bacterium YIM 96077]|uniref:ABC transporter ATP-binding protein n=1 Tax=Phytoactinopolyspora halophila TaxID=1981511 RepID=A0A329R0A8_9ACTN|nr:ABC transporter ATP-binding protein [Phytoactinopolyspora halophila]AYY13345.1 ABC transporter ATP-binding protein [Actinobacteria bacterium YIM 96077]RAW17419.1 ABC transporter ATP-binding protein [Phytoactinopolyspora halophila]